MTSLCPLDIPSAVGLSISLPQITASSPSPSHPTSAHAVPPSPPPVQRPTQNVPSDTKPTPYTPPQNGNDLFSPREWAEDGFQLYSDEVDATVAELRNSVVSVEAFGGRNFYEHVPSLDRIDAFLKETELYSDTRRRWRQIPKVCTKVDDLFRPMRVLVDAIMEYFGYLRTRPVVDSFNIPADHLEFNYPHRKPDCMHRTTPLKKIPHMMALGVSGSNFGPLPSVFESGPSYAACISPVELQTEDKRDATSDLIQLALYARQCFLRQHNRRFVYALLLTERTATLYMFDRSGVCRARAVDIHARPAALVSLLLGVWAADDAAVGFDTTITWGWDAPRARWRRYIDTCDEFGGPQRYALKDPVPVYERWFIEGRGTACWAADDGDGEDVVIKDVWRDPSEMPEAAFLEAARGIAGVGQMVWAEDGGVCVSALRGVAVPVSQRAYFVERQFCRLVLVDYGKRHIGKFKGRKDFLHGFRDAITGHQNLWNAGILHGDVNMENILFASHHASPGGRSVLIDLDLAMWVKSRDNHPASKFHNLGTRAYMSLNVLESQHDPQPTFSRDYLDDLESFYYLLLHICTTYTGPGTQRTPKPDFIRAWEQPDTHAAALAKIGSLMCVDVPPTAYFGDTFEDLLEGLRALVAEGATRKRREAAHRARTGAPPPTWDALRAAAAADYARVLRLVDDAIYEVRYGRFAVVEDPAVEAAYRERVLKIADPLPLPAGVGAGAGLSVGRKRGREDEEVVKEESPPPKRLRIHPPVAGMLF